MPKIPRCWFLFALLAAPLLLRADPEFDAVRQRDDARIVAQKAGDAAALAAILSDDLHYAHSSGTENNKTTYLAALTSGHTKYESIVFEDRKFTHAAPGIILVTGKCMMKETKDGKFDALHLNFLSVWRLENGTWRFLAWQANRLKT